MQVFKDPSFKEKDAKRSTLAIVQKRQSISFGVIDYRSKSFLVFGNYVFSEEEAQSPAKMLSYLIAKEPIVSWEYDAVKFGYGSSKSTLCPNELIDEVSPKALLNFNFSDTKGLELMHDVGDINPVAFVYGMDYTLKHMVEKLFKNLSWNHIGKIVSDKLTKQQGPKFKESVFVYINPTYVEFYVVKEEALIFHNAFDYQTKEDFIYFLMLVFEQLNLSSEHCPLRFIGELERNSAIFDITLKYVRDIDFIVRNNEFLLPKEMLNVPGHFYYDLYAMA